MGHLKGLKILPFNVCLYPSHSFFKHATLKQSILCKLNKSHTEKMVFIGPRLIINNLKIIETALQYFWPWA